MSAYDPGTQWRVLAWTLDGEERFELGYGIPPYDFGDDGIHEAIRTPTPLPSRFDELVVDQWLHVEQMDDRQWWMKIGEVTVWVDVGKDGTAERVTIRGDEP